MSRSDLLQTLDRYCETWSSHNDLYSTWLKDHEVSSPSKFRTFIHANERCFERSNTPGHFTGSALVVNKDLTKVLLTHHRKLNAWLQLGGHADGHPVVHEVAMTEALEESGLRDLYFLPYESKVFGASSSHPLPFDLDHHRIPANARDEAHDHYDVRYLVVADDQERPLVSEESLDVQWFTLDEARKLTAERSMHRQFDKVEALRGLLAQDS